MHSAPWFREHDGWWYFYDRSSGRRRQVKLVRGEDQKDAAFDRWHELCRSPKPVPKVSPESAVGLIDTFLDWCLKNRAQGTYNIYLHHLSSFSRSIGADMTVSELKPKNVTKWIDGMTASDSTKSGAVTTVRTAFNWLVREGYITHSPVAGARAPAKRGREVILSPEQLQKVLDNSRPDFRRLLEFMRHTGCRPQEVAKVEARHVDLANARIVFPASESKGKKHPRVLYLDDHALGLILELCQKHPQGKLFRNSQGMAWNRNMVRCRFRRLREKVGANFCAYHLRHTFATDALQRLDPITVATLMGHSDVSTLARNYQHLAKLPAYMLEAAKKATSECA